MTKIALQCGQIWRDDCYYLNQETNACERKYVLILAVNEKGDDAVTAVFTTKPNGLTVSPACSLGEPRAGYFVGIPGGSLPQESWVEFNSVRILDSYDLSLHVKAGRTSLIGQTLPISTLCSVLRCASQCEDISFRALRYIGDAIASLGCS
ncbi:hypothetical protein VOM14_06050 [Paraburkholderia sp. MPAMCS5]|uniref:hypothetical protein n=1 Tax=Paraburkholderia sp. MPAMCS5 TaxID=3112563 RepID=UPI002E19402E|nr:hypothetical protein [Paraburkholderia sp. MPAMCS5]